MLGKNVFLIVVFMMKINVYSEKSGNFGANSEKKPMITIESKRKSLESLKEKYPDAMIIDVTSHAQDEFVKFSPFYPNGGIPVPLVRAWLQYPLRVFGKVLRFSKMLI